MAVKESRNPEVAIYDTTSETVKWFPFSSESDLTRVFRSMMSLEQPLLVFPQTRKDGFGFLEASYVSINSITDKNDFSFVETKDASATVYSVNHARKESSNLVNKIRVASELETRCWLVAHENNEIIDILIATQRQACNALAPFPHEYLGTQHTPISVNQAQELFGNIQSQSTDPRSGTLDGIPFLFPKDGCDQRSNAMARFIISAGVFPFKIWVHANDLRFSTAHDPRCEVRWDYHNAPAVLTSEGLYVIDPSVSQCATSVENWLRNFIGTEAPKIYVGSHQIYFFHRSGCLLTSDPEYKDTDYQLALYRNALRLQTLEYGFPPCSNHAIR